MKFSLFLFFLFLVVHGWITNNGENIPEEFELLGRTSPKQLHQFRIALKQRNIDTLEATLLDVSNPDSKNYGKWWTSDQILDLIAPSEESIQPVISWLKSHPISKLDVSGRDFIKVIAQIEVIELMFNTEMHDFRLIKTGQVYARTFGRVNIPDHLTNMIELVTGLTELVPKSKGVSRSIPRNYGNDPMGYIYPTLLRAMYNVPSTFPVHPSASIAVIEFYDNSSYGDDEIDEFNSYMNENVNVAVHVGPFHGNDDDPDSNLHIQYAGSMALNTTTWFWTVENWMYEFATDLFNAKPYPLVVSMSDGFSEADQCSDTMQASCAYVTRVNAEYVKLGLKGITLVTMSGDLGAPGYDNNNCTMNILSPSFPASSPWVTTVGATRLVYNPMEKNLTLNFPPLCNKLPCGQTKTETAASFSWPWTISTSGGGFSNVATMPIWQQNFVTSYLDSGVPLPTGLFDPTKRAYPDVAVNGIGYCAAQDEQYMDIDDTTAASTPVFAAMIALLNSVMLNNGRQPLGFINPLLYKMAAEQPSTFTDITTGSNLCTGYPSFCCSDIGYVATKGWDPVTGLGTPLFSNMQSYIQKVLVNKNMEEY